MLFSQLLCIIILVLVGAASILASSSEMGSASDERTVLFHGFVQLEDSFTRNQQVIGSPSTNLVSFPAAFLLEYIWCATMGPSFFRNDARGQPLVREKKLAFSAFCMDMHF
jgi:hypothetical protein